MMCDFTLAGPQNRIPPVPLAFDGSEQLEKCHEK